MFTAYHFKIVDEWVPPLEYLPRWLEANGYPSLFDTSEFPSTRSWPTPEKIFSTPSATGLPSNWSLTSSSPVTSGSLLQKLFSNFTYQKSQLRASLLTLYYSITGSYDLSEPAYAWTSDFSGPVNSVAVYYGSGLVQIKPALGIRDLFEAGEPRYFREDNKIIIAGLDIVETSTEVVSGWQAFQNQNIWRPGETVYFQHPKSKSFIPIHYQDYSDLGILPFEYGFPARARIRKGITSTLKDITIYVNNSPVSFRATNLWTSIDEKGLWFNFSRQDLEDHISFADHLKNVSIFGGQSYKQTQLNLSFRFRAGSALEYFNNTLDAVVASGSVHQVNGFTKDEYVSELLIHGPNPNSFYSIYTNPAYGFILSQTRTHSYYTSGGLIYLDPPVLNKSELVQAFWRIDNWTQTSTGITFLDVFKPAHNLRVGFSRKVKVNYPSEAEFRKAFKKDASLRWHNIAHDFKIEKGLAVFE